MLKILIALVALTSSALAGSGSFPATNGTMTSYIALDAPPPGATQLLVRTTGGSFSTAWGYEWNQATPFSADVTYRFGGTISAYRAYSNGYVTQLYQQRYNQRTHNLTCNGYDGVLDYWGSSGFTLGDFGGIASTGYETFTFPAGLPPSHVQLNVRNIINQSQGAFISNQSYATVDVEWTWQ